MADEQYGDESVRALHGDTNAAAWADAFTSIFDPDLTGLDWGTMVGWFANAIETGRTAGREAR